MALALALVAAAPPLVIHNGWPGLAAAVAAVVYAAYLLLGKRWSLRRHQVTRPGPALSATARAFAKLLAGHGFARDRYVFRRYNEAGDALLVDFHPLPSADGATRFAVHVGFLLAPYWEWEKHSLGYPPEKRPDMSHVNWVQQVTPVDWSEDAPSRYDEWVVTDEAEAPAVAERIHQRLPDLLLWLDRDLLWRAAMGGSTELGAISEQLKIWLLVERGQSEELRHLLDEDDGDVWDFAKRRNE